MKDAIGVIGGMGPLALQLFYNMITEYRNGLDNIEEYIRRYKCS